MLRATWILFRTHLRSTLLSRRALLALLVTMGPVAAALLVAFVAKQEEGPPPAFQILWALQVQLVVPLVSLILGSAVFAEEVEDRTITYLYTRPIPRSAVLLGRWLAALVVLSAILSASSWLVVRILGDLAVGSRDFSVPPVVQLAFLKTILLGGAVYSAVFAAAGTFLKHPVIVGLGYTFAIETFLANLPIGGNQGLAIMYYLKSYLAGSDPLLADRFHEMGSSELVSSAEGLTRLLTILVVAGLVGAWTVSRKQYVLPS